VFEAAIWVKSMYMIKIVIENQKKKRK